MKHSFYIALSSTTAKRGLMALACILVAIFVLGQANEKHNFSLKNGSVYITIDKSASASSIDSFIARYNLFHLPLHLLIRDTMPPELKQQGWSVIRNTKGQLILLRKIEGLSLGTPNQQNATGQLAEALLTLTRPVSTFGVNRFVKNREFLVLDSIVTFHCRKSRGVNRVMLAGSFTNWQYGAIAMTETDSGFIAHVKLPPGKHWYKYIVDGGWQTDSENLLSENDGEGNMNSVYFKTNHTFKIYGYTQVGQAFVNGSFNDWNNRPLALRRMEHGWYLPVFLPDGTYTYRYRINEQWITDPGNTSRFPNGQGAFNSVLQVGKPFVFKLNGFLQAKEVMLVGSFNGWREGELFLKRSENGWTLPYALGPGNYEYVYKVDGAYIKAPAFNGNSSKNFTYSIGANHRFVLGKYLDASSVSVAGDFNNWSENAFEMKKVGSVWILDVHLSSGKHKYKFLVDGKWILDPQNKLWEENEYGTGNSIVWVKTP